MLVEEIVSQEEAQGLPSSELDAVENQLKWASWELHSLRHCGEDENCTWVEDERVWAFCPGPCAYSCVCVCVCEISRGPTHCRSLILTAFALLTSGLLFLVININLFVPFTSLEDLPISGWLAFAIL